MVFGPARYRIADPHMTTESVVVQPVPDPDEKVDADDTVDDTEANQAAALLIRLTVGEVKVLERCTGEKLSKLAKDLEAEEFSADIIEAFAAIGARRDNPDLTWDEAIEAADDVDINDAIAVFDGLGDDPPV